VYNTLIRSAIEYANPLFINLKIRLTKEIEKLLKRAHFIICGNGEGCNCKLDSLEERREKSALNLFQNIRKSKNHILNSLLPSLHRNRFILNHCNLSDDDNITQRIRLSTEQFD